ncbi:MAG: glycosyltransferase [Candidatus Competibacteraceae bacterium]|nr:glycosyltransferase [Candidatus Competibacteraceae bacterium]
MAMDSPVRVLHLGSPAGLYGAERWILALMNNIDRARVDSAVAVIRDDPNLGADLCVEAGRQGFCTHVFEAYGKVSWSAVRMLRAYIRAERIDILHTHWYKTDMIGLLAALGTPCKLVSTPHGWSKQAGLKLRFYEALARRVFCHLDAVAPLSQELFDDLATRPCLKGKLHFIPNGVDLSDVCGPMAITPDIAAWKAEGCFVFGYVGQLIKRKGLDVLLQALAGCPDENWRLALVGEGDERGALEAQARALGIGDQVRFFGFREDRIAFLKGFDAFVLPSRLEGIPRSLMESMAAGVATIASDISGCRDLIAQGESGLLFVPDSVVDLRGALLRLLRDDTLRSRLAAAGQRTIKENWSAEIMAKRYAHLYEGLVQ